MKDKFQQEWDEAIAYLREQRIYRPGLFEIYDTVEKLRLAKSMVSPKRCPGKDYG